jgi:hypothetical protein
MPKKDTQYFQHDYNARSDKKMAALLMKYKSAGYGVYWCVVEMMHEEKGLLEFDKLTILSIAKDMNEDSDTVSKILKDCIDEFKLFEMNGDNMLKSNRVLKNIKHRQKVSKSRAIAGKRGAIAKQLPSKC